MGILTGTVANDEKGLHIYKSCSVCLANGGSAPGCNQGKFSQFRQVTPAPVSRCARCDIVCPSARPLRPCRRGQPRRRSTFNAKFGQSTNPLNGGEVDENHCSDLCSTNGCGVDSVPAACAARWGPSGRQNLQDPDADFRIITIRAARKASGSAPVFVSVFVDGFHSSSQPPGYLTGNAAANTYASSDAGITSPIITTLMFGVKVKSDGTASFMSGDIAEVLIYNKALKVPEMDRVANYLGRK
jgi:hypothetical protein